MTSQEFLQHGNRPQSGSREKHRNDLIVEYAFRGSGRRRVRGLAFSEGSRGSATIRYPVLVLNPAFAAATGTLSVNLNFIYSLIW